MCLRTTQRKNKDGTVSVYYQLAHNERHPVTGKSSAKIIHSFGRADQVDLVRVCRSIARIYGVTVVDRWKAVSKHLRRNEGGGDN